MDKDPLIVEIEKLAARLAEQDDFLLQTARTINRFFPQYNWVGFYFLRAGQLHIGPYVGKPTPHTVIDLDRGICGAAVSQEKTIVVDDVNADPRYLACSLETKSEIVIPIRVGGEIIGELDIDSDKKGAFGDNQRIVLEKISDLVGEYLGRLNHPD